MSWLPNTTACLSSWPTWLPPYVRVSGEHCSDIYPPLTSSSARTDRLKTLPQTQSNLHACLRASVSIHTPGRSQLKKAACYCQLDRSGGVGREINTCRRGWQSFLCFTHNQHHYTVPPQPIMVRQCIHVAAAEHAARCSKAARCPFMGGMERVGAAEMKVLYSESLAARALLNAATW